MNRDTLQKDEVVKISVSVRITEKTDMDLALNAAAGAVQAAQEHFSQLNCKRFMSSICVRAGLRKMRAVRRRDHGPRRKSATRLEDVPVQGKPQ